MSASVEQNYRTDAKTQDQYSIDLVSDLQLLGCAGGGSVPYHGNAGRTESIQGGMRLAVIGAVALVCIGVVGLGVVESREDDELRRARQEASNYRYAKSWLAICLPVAYCLLDAAGTFADSLVLETLDEDAANCV